MHIACVAFTPVQLLILTGRQKGRRRQQDVKLQRSCPEVVTGWNFSFPQQLSAALRRFAAITLAALCLVTVLAPQMSAAESKPSRAARKKADELVVRANLAHRKGKFAQAAQLFLDAFNSDPAWADGLASAARSYEQAEMLEEAAKYYAEFIAAPLAERAKVLKARVHAAHVNRLRTDSGRYTIDAEGARALDNTTGLTWERGPDAAPLDWPHAKIRCDEMGRNRGRVWRLPTTAELLGLLSGDGTGLNNRVFPNVSRSLRWSSNTDATGKAVLAVHFRNGQFSSSSPTDGVYSICVSSPPGLPIAKMNVSDSLAAAATSTIYRVDATAGTVFDTRTQLNWQRDTDGKDYNWQQANEYCASLRLSGRAWRLPSKHELERLVENGKLPSIDHTAFPNTPAAGFWTATEYAGPARNAWFVYFGYGYSYVNNVSNSNRVRCVR